jgi:hypothetical protein
MSHGFTWGKAYTIEGWQLVVDFGTGHSCLLVIIDDRGGLRVLYGDSVVVLPKDFAKNLLWN